MAAQRAAFSWVVVIHLVVGVLAGVALWPSWRVHLAPFQKRLRDRGSRPGADAMALSGGIAWWGAGGALATGLALLLWTPAWLVRLHSGFGLAAAGALLVHLVTLVVNDEEGRGADGPDAGRHDAQGHDAGAS